jgi:hypothetical protein
MKGHLDTIASPNNFDTIQCGIDGSPRRCGGQGDLLSGTLVASYYWAIKSREKIEQQPSTPDKSPKPNERQMQFSKITPA